MQSLKFLVYRIKILVEYQALTLVTFINSFKAFGTVVTPQIV